MKKRNRPRNPLSPRNDYIFRRIFGDPDDKGVLTEFLKAALDIPWDEYGEIEIVAPESKIDFVDDKLNVLDIKLHTKSGTVIDIEIQRHSKKAFRERIVYNISKLIEEQLGSGDDYNRIHPAICIVITEFALIRENGAYHNRYEFCDMNTGSTFSGIACIHVFELAKLPARASGGDEPILDWLRFLDSDEVKSMESIAEKNEGVGKAVARYKVLTADERERLIADAIEKRRRDKVAEIMFARDEGLAEGIEKGIEKGLAKGQYEIARRMLAKGLDKALIGELTGLSEEELSEL
ncbi:MAG: Rpn family recombination-promoting nuclease/putative transposase [Clostridiales Family XIII bacterium]|jgi:predicted transposase/invertase (TIGR01784 family)|nr:Rpn family recombination-promoting nuclease/putative transposase [Clostridiales Family XIII bacterium]